MSWGERECLELFCTYFSLRFMSITSDFLNFVFLYCTVDFASMRLKISSRRSSLLRSSMQASTSFRILSTNSLAFSSFLRSVSSLPTFFNWASISIGYFVRRCDTDNENPFKPLRLSSGLDSLCLYHSEKRWSPFWYLFIVLKAVLWFEQYSPVMWKKNWQIIEHSASQINTTLYFNHSP